MEITISCFAQLCCSDPSTMPDFPNSPRVVRRLPTGIQLVGFEQGAGRVFDECKPSDRSVYRQRTQQAEMVRFYGMKPEQIHVVPEGVDTRIFRPAQDLQSLTKWRVKVFGSDIPYIVYVGKPVERRNLSALIKAFGLMKKTKTIPHKLLIVGSDLAGASPFRQVITTESLTNEVVILGYVNYQEMPLVYNSADLLIYPSSYEGLACRCWKQWPAEFLQLHSIALPFQNSPREWPIFWRMPKSLLSSRALKRC